MQEAASIQTGHRYRGQVVYLYAFDIAHDMRPGRIEQILGATTFEYALLSTKRSPKRMFFYRPDTAILPTRTLQTATSLLEVQPIVKVFGIGAVSIQIRIPFGVNDLSELIRFHDLQLRTHSLQEEIVEMARTIREDLSDRTIRPSPVSDFEAYTAFCIEELPETDHASALDWLEEHRGEVAGLLKQEEQPALLSRQEAVESTGRHISYYRHDLVVVDWDAALVVGGGEYLDDILHIADLANVQLIELRVYDQNLDTAVDQAYRDLRQRRPRPRRDVIAALREIHVDMARLTDELENLSKFFGEWHLARLYGMIAERFHLSDWHHILDSKLKTLGDLYQLLQQERTNFWMVVLETTIVLLFILDVILLLAGL